MDWTGLAKNLSPSLGNLISQGIGMFNDDWKNPSDAAMGDISHIPDAMKPYFDPYMNAGQGALPQMQSQYGSLLNDPGAMMNKFGESYQKSPGFDFALKNALRAGTNAAAAGGMAGSPQHERWNMETATGLANQDYNDWLSKALGLYQRGLSGQEGLYNTGFSASNNMAQSIQDALAKQAELKYKGQEAENEHNASKGSFWGGLGELAGAAIPFFL